MGDRQLGPFGIDPLHFSALIFGFLLLFVLYLLLPRGFRVHRFGAYPKRYAWSARSRARRNGQRQHMSSGASVGTSSIATGMTGGTGATQNQRQYAPQGIAAAGSASVYSSASMQRRGRSGLPGGAYDPPNQDTVVFDPSAAGPQQNNEQFTDMQQNDEIVISAAMQQLRDPGVLIVAHGSRGKPKTVRLQLTESAITWRTETRKKSSGAKEPKMGKLHQVPLSHIMYVDVGKQTTALRRVENAAVSESLCFSLLTKEGSLDLEANSPRERDALVSCFSLVLDEVHAQNWRDIYRGPSSDMPSSFDDYDQPQNQNDGGVSAGVGGPSAV